MQPTRMAA